MMACAAAGHSKFLLKRRKNEGTKWGKIIAALVLSDLQGKGYERKEAFLLTAFWLLCGDKVTATAATERSKIDNPLILPNKPNRHSTVNKHPITVTLNT
ncbi:hypothetical protein G7092_14445 [Mucilaginibacter sp. HC2]|uniref:hypothetical protein n=1 Tax=Mucilaginibacter inviolabilis TaxID=2714892 RepID=UPI001408FCD0|nr:hypothetical protein [Mucilaginibacter inviolabilis]NHA05007.1 hypothetical protein [Mucilaginibacter inviolabilis]